MDAFGSDAGGWSLALEGAEAYGLRVAASWKELVDSLRTRHEGGEALTPAVVWREFKQQAERSSRVDVKQLAEIGEKMTPDDRVWFAVGVMPLLAMLDWPSAWESPRRELVAALEGLVVEMDSQQPNSFTGVLLSLVNSDHAPVLAGASSMAWISLHISLRMLRKPCPPGELGEAAILCMTATSALAPVARDDSSGPPLLAEARSRYLTAFERYARAARAMNDAVGRVVFEGLELGTQGDR